MLWPSVLATVLRGWGGVGEEAGEEGETGREGSERKKVRTYKELRKTGLRAERTTSIRKIAVSSPFQCCFNCAVLCLCFIQLIA